MPQSDHVNSIQVLLFTLRALVAHVGKVLLKLSYLLKTRQLCPPHRIPSYITESLSLKTLYLLPHKSGTLLSPKQ